MQKQMIHNSFRSTIDLRRRKKRKGLTQSLASFDKFNFSIKSRSTEHNNKCSNFSFVKVVLNKFFISFSLLKLRSLLAVDIDNVKMKLYTFDTRG
jgi:hypothetical protein